MFVHEDEMFQQLLGVTARARSLTMQAVANDYWAVHALWALQRQGFAISLRAGVALSKGFGLITRPSACLDLKVAPGSTGLTPPPDWRARSERAVLSRREYLEAIARTMQVPGARAELAEVDPLWRGAKVRLLYSSVDATGAAHAADGHVILAIHAAWAKPAVACPVRAFVHDELSKLGLEQAFQDTRTSVPCVHPIVTLLEKIEVLQRSVLDETVSPLQFARHFEDGARIVRNCDRLPPLTGYGSAFELASDMRADGELRALPSSIHDAFRPDDSPRWREVREAYDGIASAQREPRIGLDEACESLRSWIDRNVD